jgi:hypothetical protein
LGPMILEGLNVLYFPFRVVSPCRAVMPNSARKVLPNNSQSDNWVSFSPLFEVKFPMIFDVLVERGNWRHLPTHPFRIERVGADMQVDTSALPSRAFDHRLKRGDRRIPVRSLCQ